MNRRRNLDHYSRKAKAQGYAARSVFKLEEINQKFKVLKRGNYVVDLGCAPGSWLKYAARKVGPTGWCVGIDRTPVSLSLDNVETIVGDIYDIDANTFDRDGRKFNLVMSDMAPDTCGNRQTDHIRSIQLCERALTVARLLLAPGGHFVCKVFEGGDLNDFVRDVKTSFGTVKRVKPKSTRSESVELFVVAKDFHTGQKST